MRMRFEMLAVMLCAICTGCGKAPAPRVVETKLGDTAFTWTRAAQIPGVRFESATEAIEEKLYIFGGTTGDLRATVTVHCYDPAADAWEALPDLPAATTHQTAVYDGAWIWFVGGFKGDNPGVATNEVWRYRITDGHAEPGPVLPEPVASMGAVLAGRTLHAFGGLKPDRDTDSPAHWTLDVDSGTDWRTAAPMPRPRNHFGVAYLGGKIYAVGGQLGHDRHGLGPWEDVDYVDVYDPATDSWETRAPMPIPISHNEPATFVYANRIISIGGRSITEETVARIFAYDPAEDVWTELPPLPLAFMAPAARVVGGKVVVVCGRIGSRGQVQEHTWQGDAQVWEKRLAAR